MQKVSTQTMKMRCTEQGNISETHKIHKEFISKILSEQV